MPVDGAVDHPFTLSLDDLRSLPATTILATLECAGNNRASFAPLPRGEPWGAGALSTAEWRGVPLRNVLEPARLHSITVELLFEGADQGAVEGSAQALPFARSLPLDKALHPDTLLAYEMNGEPLPPEHGGPVRLLVPGWYGMASVKWLVHIAALEQPFAGFFQAQRYVLDIENSPGKVPLREMYVKSIITSPVTGEALAQGPLTVSGVAWSGLGAIKSVEVSTEGGGAWHPARMVGLASRYGWQQWEYEWSAGHAGRHVLRARATDEHGNVQPDAALWNRLGYANNSIQPVMVEVQE
jgi:DMSO/TMAO reductase YedYZ molybdopterin-dependent catalytic subunit